MCLAIAILMGVVGLPASFFLLRDLDRLYPRSDASATQAAATDGEDKDKDKENGKGTGEVIDKVIGQAKGQEEKEGEYFYKPPVLPESAPVSESGSEGMFNL